MPSDWNIPDSFDSFCSVWPGADLKGYDEGYEYPHQPFSNMFLMHAIFP